MNYLSLGMEERRRFAGLLNSLSGLEAPAWYVAMRVWPVCPTQDWVCVCLCAHACTCVCVCAVESGSRRACGSLCRQRDERGHECAGACAGVRARARVCT